MSTPQQKAAKPNTTDEVSTPRSRLDALDFALIHEKLKPRKSTGDQLAKRFGVSRDTITVRLNKPDFKEILAEELEESNKTARKLLSEGNAEAVMVLRKLMRKGTDAIKRDAARTYLEYTIPKKLINENRDKKDPMAIPPEVALEAARLLVERKKKRRN